MGGINSNCPRKCWGFFWPWFYVVFFFLKNILLLAHKSIWKDEIYFFPSLILKSRAKAEPQKQVR